MSTPTIFFANAAGAVLAHPDGYAIGCYQPGALQVPAFQSLIQKLHQLLQVRAWHKVLIDVRASAATVEEAQVWGRAHRATLPSVPRFLLQATLLPAQLCALLTMTELQVGARSGYCAVNFSDEAAAHAFLRQQPTQAPRYWE